jgi:hypothetical protein
VVESDNAEERLVRVEQMLELLKQRTDKLQQLTAGNLERAKSLVAAWRTDRATKTKRA